jgi:sugar/nucleoside kinase (ribokinase family)
LALDTITTPAGHVERVIGGSAIHFSNAASLTSRVHIVGVVGEDFPFAEVAYLKDRGVDFSAVEIVPGGRTFFWKGRYEADLSQAISEITELNVFETFHPHLPDSACKSDVLFLANIHPRLQAGVLDAMGCRVYTVLDSMNFWISGEREALLEVIARVDAVILNDAEVRSLAGEHNLLRAARKLAELGPSCIVVKKGEHGVLAVHRDWVVALPAFPLEKIVDPTGAGDSFAGALVGFLERSCRGGARPEAFADREVWKRALAYATCVASVNVEDFSIRGISRLTLPDVAARFGAYAAASFLEGGLDVAHHAAG